MPPLTGMPRLRDLPKERRQLVQERYKHLSNRSWQTWAALAGAFVITLVVLPLLPTLRTRCVHWSQDCATGILGALAGATFAAIFIGIATPKWRRNYRAALRQNLFCADCGYDLSTDPDAICPQCGLRPMNAT